MSDDELRKKHAHERMVNAWFEEKRAIDEQERAAARVSKARAAVADADKAIREAYALESGSPTKYIRYGSDKVLIVTAAYCRVEVLHNGA